jgi:hypothetical protein
MCQWPAHCQRLAHTSEVGPPGARAPLCPLRVRQSPAAAAHRHGGALQAPRRARGPASVGPGLGRPPTPTLALAACGAACVWPPGRPRAHPAGRGRTSTIKLLVNLNASGPPGHSVPGTHRCCSLKAGHPAPGSRFRPRSDLPLSVTAGLSSHGDSVRHSDSEPPARSLSGSLRLQARGGGPGAAPAERAP